MRRFNLFLVALTLITLLVSGSSNLQAQAPEPVVMLPPPMDLAPIPSLVTSGYPVTPDAAYVPSLPGDVTLGPIETMPVGSVFPMEPPIPVEPMVAQPICHWYHPAYWFGPTPWDIGFELGINGAQGINEAFSFRTGGHLKRETDLWKFDSTLFYNKNSANNVDTQSNALLDVRVDRKLGESPWSLFFLNQELYDEFQAYDIRVSANSGLGYQFIDTEHLDLVGRFGLGASREFGGPDDSTAFEALFGMEYDHEITKTQRLTAKVDYFPEWSDFGRYRVVTDLGWEIDLDQPGNVSLKFSIIDRYDSTPNGAKPNELNYAVLLIFGI